MFHYESLPPDIETALADPNRGPSPYACRDADAVRRDATRDVATALRPPFLRDGDKILHSPFYNRYADKTQVFSLYRNDDLSRRGLHVQLVSRVARTLGRALGLNLDLIEAIALGHDIGHTPFGHAGEAYLDAILQRRTGQRFSHNIQSVRVLDGIFPYNITLQTLDGIASHDGELELSEYRPTAQTDFAAFDAAIASCWQDKANVRRLRPSTLEGCVVRLSDIIAYLGKDRQDAARAHRAAESEFTGGAIGTHNAEIINNLIVNVVTNSFHQPYLRMDDEHFAALKQAKAENYDRIYHDASAKATLDATVKPMMEQLYDRLLDDWNAGRETSPIFTHHLAEIDKPFYQRRTPYTSSSPDQIVTDYIASMTDDYFVDLYAHLFPNSPLRIRYHGYFD